VNNLEKSIKFFTKLGFKFNPKFTDKNATCMIISDNIYSMLIVKKMFKTFTKKEISDAKKSTEVLISLQLENRKKVDELVKKAITAGGKSYLPTQDHGWMYTKNFADLDGHQWELFFMDESKMPKMN